MTGESGSLRTNPRAGRRVLVFTPLTLASFLIAWVTWSQIISVGNNIRTRGTVVAGDPAEQLSNPSDPELQISTSPSTATGHSFQPSVAASTSMIKQTQGQQSPASTDDSRDDSGWVPYFSDDFNGALTNWVTYDGSDGTLGARWSPSHVNVVNGALQLAAYRDGAVPTFGAVELRSKPVKYGRIEIKYRMLATGYGYQLMLWPTENNTSGSITLATDDSENHQTFISQIIDAESSLHKTTVTSDASEWNALSMEWKPRSLVISLNNRTVAKLNGKSVPSNSQRIVIKQFARNCSNRPCPDGAGNLEIDWIRMYTWG